MTGDWLEYNIALAELLMEYNDELDEYLEDYDGTTPEDAKNKLIEFFDKKGQGKVIRTILKGVLP